MGTESASEKKKPGAKRLDVVRVCSVCGVDVVRPGVLRPKPLCARHYFEHRRRAAGVQPRTAPRFTVAEAAALLAEVGRALREEVMNYTDQPDVDEADTADRLQPHGEYLDVLATRCDDAVAALARTYPTVRGSTAKKGAKQ